MGEPKMEPICAGDYLCQKLGLMHDGGGSSENGDQPDFEN